MRAKESVIALAAALALAMSGGPARAQSPQLRFDIPAGEASETLKEFFAQSNIPLLFIADTLRGVQTNAIKGVLEAPEALQQMLKGTPVRFEFKDRNSEPYFAITPLPVESGAADAATQARSLLPHPESLAGDGMTADRLGAAALDEVVVTGTLIHGVLDIVSPLEILQRRQMKGASYATVQDVLSTMPAMTGGGPSEDTVGPGNFTRGMAANLRGLGAGATLVLVNGHRQPFSGANGDFVDLSLLPSAAIERIEVLPDGASALYGSDAVAGVVNVIMRRDFGRPETDLRYGIARGGADERMFAQLFGTRWDTGNALFSYQYSDRSALPAAERNYAANADKTSRGGDDFRAITSAPGNIVDPATFLPVFGIPADANGVVTVSDLEPGRINLQNAYDLVQLLPSRKVHSLFLSGAQRIGERFELSGDLRVSRRDFELISFAAQQLLVVPRTNPFFVSPFGEAPFVIVGYSFQNDLGPGISAGRAQSYDANVGLHGDFGESWRFSLSQSYGHNRERYTTYNQIDNVRLQIALADPDPATAFNPFGDGHQNSQSIIAAIRSVQAGSAASTLMMTSMVADGAVRQLPSGAVKLALGTEFRQEQFEKQFPANRTLTRSVHAAFAELSIPIVGDGDDWRSTPRLELSLSGRYEQYSDFGSTWNPKIGLRWAPTPWLKLRTSWGTSFRAPNLVDVYDTSQDLTVLLRLRDPQSPYGSSVVLARQGKNEDLRAENAVTWMSGIDFAPEVLPGLTVSLSYFQIDYANRIVVPASDAPLDILQQEDRWPGVVMRDPSFSRTSELCESPQFRGSVNQCLSTPIAAVVDFRPHNMAATRVNGVDLSINLPLDTDYGHLGFALNGGYLFDFRQALSTAVPSVDLVNTVGNPLALRLRGTAEWSQRGWDRPGFGVSFSVDHAGGYRDLESQLARRVDRATTLDARFSYRTSAREGLWGDIEFALNANNVFDRDPPFVNREVGYDTANAEPYGRVVSFSMQKQW